MKIRIQLKELLLLLCFSIFAFQTICQAQIGQTDNQLIELSNYQFDFDVSNIIHKYAMDIQQGKRVDFALTSNDGQGLVKYMYAQLALVGNIRGCYHLANTDDGTEYHSNKTYGECGAGISAVRHPFSSHNNSELTLRLYGEKCNSTISSLSKNGNNQKSLKLIAAKPSMKGHIILAEYWDNGLVSVIISLWQAKEPR